MTSSNQIDFDKVTAYKLCLGLFDIDQFKCSKKKYEDYIRVEAYEDQCKSIAQTWVFVYDQKHVVGFVTIAMGDLNKTQHEKLKAFPHVNVPGLLIGRLATHKNFENQGVGQKMVDWVFAKAISYSHDIGCRILYLNPEKGVEGWYAKKMRFIHIKKSGKLNIMFHDLHLYK